MRELVFGSHCVPFAFLNIIPLNGSTVSKTTIVNDSIQSAGDKIIWILGSTTSGLQFWIRIQRTWKSWYKEWQLHSPASPFDTSTLPLLRVICSYSMCQLGLILPFLYASISFDPQPLRLPLLPLKSKKGACLHVDSVLCSSLLLTCKGTRKMCSMVATSWSAMCQWFFRAHPWKKPPQSARRNRIETSVNELIVCLKCFEHFCIPLRNVFLKLLSKVSLKL